MLAYRVAEWRAISRSARVCHRRLFGSGGHTRHRHGDKKPNRNVEPERKGGDGEFCPPEIEMDVLKGGAGALIKRARGLRDKRNSSDKDWMKLLSATEAQCSFLEPLEAGSIIVKIANSAPPSLVKGPDAPFHKFLVDFIPTCEHNLSAWPPLALASLLQAAVLSRVPLTEGLLKMCEASERHLRISKDVDLFLRFVDPFLALKPEACLAVIEGAERKEAVALKEAPLDLAVSFHEKLMAMEKEQILKSASRELQKILLTTLAQRTDDPLFKGVTYARIFKIFSGSSLPRAFLRKEFEILLPPLVDRISFFTPLATSMSLNGLAKVKLSKNSINEREILNLCAKMWTDSMLTMKKWQEPLSCSLSSLALARLVEQVGLTKEEKVKACFSRLAIFLKESKMRKASLAQLKQIGTAFALIIPKEEKMFWRVLALRFGEKLEDGEVRQEEVEMVFFLLGSLSHVFKEQPEEIKEIRQLFNDLSSPSSPLSSLSPVGQPSKAINSLLLALCRMQSFPKALVQSILQEAVVRRPREFLQDGAGLVAITGFLARVHYAFADFDRIWSVLGVHLNEWSLLQLENASKMGRGEGGRAEAEEFLNRVREAVRILHDFTLVPRSPPQEFLTFCQKVAGGEEVLRLDAPHFHFLSSEEKFLHSSRLMLALLLSKLELLPPPCHLSLLSSPPLPQGRQDIVRYFQLAGYLKCFRTLSVSSRFLAESFHLFSGQEVHQIAAGIWSASPRNPEKAELETFLEAQNRKSLLALRPLAKHFQNAQKKSLSAVNLKESDQFFSEVPSSSVDHTMVNETLQKVLKSRREEGGGRGWRVENEAKAGMWWVDVLIR